MTDLASLTARAEKALAWTQEIQGYPSTPFTCDLIRDLLTYATTVTQERDEMLLYKNDFEIVLVDAYGALGDDYDVGYAGLPDRITRVRARAEAAEQERDAAIARAEQAELELDEFKDLYKDEFDDK